MIDTAINPKPATLSKEATAETLSTARHYGAMRFNMMAAYFILNGLLANAHINWTVNEEKHTIAFIGLAASLWFAWFEFLLSYNLTKLWSSVIKNGHEDYSGTWPHRNRALVWSARVTLPLPYLLGITAWGALLEMGCLAITAAVAICVAAIVGWFSAEKGWW